MIRGEVGQGRGCICQEDQAGGIKKENFDHATPMAVVLRTVAAQRRAQHAEPASPRVFYILLVSSGLRASPFLVSTPHPDEIHAAALLHYYVVLSGGSGSHA